MFRWIGLQVVNNFRTKVILERRRGIPSIHRELLNYIRNDAERIMLAGSSIDLGAVYFR